MDASRIIEKRKQRGLSVPQLAERLGVAKTTVYRYESGAIEKMPVSRLIEIALILDTTPAYLMFWSDEEQPHTSSFKECFELSQKLTPAQRAEVKRYIEQKILK